ncbi:MAG TPA: HNH endonuclease [Nakamurella sp.]
MSQSQGRPLRLSHADIVRWHEHLLITATCHVWMGAVGSDGYGRFQIINKYDGTRMLTPHQVAARLGFGPIPEGATLLHDCEVRLCCRYGTDHVEVGTQSENMRHAVARGRAVGPRPGRVDVRGKVGASRAIQAALRDAVDRSPAGLARVLAGVIADGDPMRDMLPLFDAPDRRAATPALRSPMRAESPSGGVLLRARRPVPASSLPLFEA